MKNIKKIVFISLFPPFRGGIADYSRQLSRGLSKKIDVFNVNFTVVYPSLFFPGKSLFEKQNTFPIIKTKRILHTINPISWIKTLLFIRSLRPHFVLLSYWTPWMALPYLFFAYTLPIIGVPLVVLLHNFTPHEFVPFAKWSVSKLIKKAKSCVVMNQNIFDKLHTTHPNIPSVLLYHPIYDHYGKKIEKKIAREKLQIQQNRVLLFFGLIRSYKGLDLLIEAFFKKNDGDCVLLIVGESYQNFDIYHQLIKKYSLEKNIRIYPNFIPNSEVKYFFSATDVCIFPYKNASQSGVLTLAYAFEVPVIVTKVGGLYESVEKYDTGIVTQPHSDGLKEAMDIFFQKDHSYYIKNIKSYNKKHTWEDFSEKLLNHFERI